MNRTHRHFPGFTLVELMIVIAIIAIIATIAIPNLMRSRMAANEASAISSCKQYVAAQTLYFRTDWDNDSVKKYADNIFGPHGLYTNNPATPGDVALVDRAFANAVGDPSTVTAGKAGYIFSILTSQGPNAPGGAQNYYRGSDLLFGHALSAIPMSWDITGRNTYQVNQAGMLTQKDRGAASGSHLTNFDPDLLWVLVQ